jgi:hypothetical protein
MYRNKDKSIELHFPFSVLPPPSMVERLGSGTVSMLCKIAVHREFRTIQCLQQTWLSSLIRTNLPKQPRTPKTDLTLENKPNNSTLFQVQASHRYSLNNRLPRSIFAESKGGRRDRFSERTASKLEEGRKKRVVSLRSQTHVMEYIIRAHNPG